MSPSSRITRFDIEVAGGTGTISPNWLWVPPGTTVQWTINVGTARIVFRSLTDFQFKNDTATPTNPAEGSAVTMGVHLYTVIVWKDERSAAFWLPSILIVE